MKQLRGEARLTEANVADALREVRMALLEADVALPVVKDFIARVKEKALGEEVIGSLTPGQALVGVVHRELTALMGGESAGLDLAVAPPAVILMAGPAGLGQDDHRAASWRSCSSEEMRKKVLRRELPTCTGRRRSSSCARSPRRRASTSSRRRRRRSRSTSRARRSTARARITTTC